MSFSTHIPYKEGPELEDYSYIQNRPEEWAQLVPFFRIKHRREDGPLFTAIATRRHNNIESANLGLSHQGC